MHFFNFQSKTAWIKREGNPIYKENDLDKWCEFLDKDLSEKRKRDIMLESGHTKKWVLRNTFQNGLRKKVLKLYAKGISV